MQAALQEMAKLRSEKPPSHPSTLVKRLNPAVERVILRCLEPVPADRPASAMAVAAALPGGDPLAAALAAGETPSPQMVAAAGETAGLSPRVGLICFAGSGAGSDPDCSDRSEGKRAQSVSQGRIPACTGGQGARNNQKSGIHSATE